MLRAMHSRSRSPGFKFIVRVLSGAVVANPLLETVAHASPIHFSGEADFADVHGLDLQRFYNVVCLAWGADPKLYGFAKDLGKLPEGRPEGCAAEYEQVRYAVRVLLRKHVDEKEIERARIEF